MEAISTLAVPTQDQLKNYMKDVACAKKAKEGRKKRLEGNQFIDDFLPDQVADTAKTDAKDDVNQLLNDSDEFAQRQGKEDYCDIWNSTPRGSSPGKTEKNAPMTSRS